MKKTFPAATQSRSCLHGRHGGSVAGRYKEAFSGVGHCDGL